MPCARGQPAVCAAACLKPLETHTAPTAPLRACQPPAGAAAPTPSPPQTSRYSMLSFWGRRTSARVTPSKRLQAAQHSRAQPAQGSRGAPACHRRRHRCLWVAHANSWPGGKGGIPGSPAFIFCCPCTLPPPEGSHCVRVCWPPNLGAACASSLSPRRCCFRHCVPIDGKQACLPVRWLES